MNRLRIGLLSGAVLVWAALNVFHSFSRSYESNGGDDVKHEKRYVVEHVQVVFDKSLEEVTNAFKSQLGLYDPSVLKSLAKGEGKEETNAKISKMVALLASCSLIRLIIEPDHDSIYQTRLKASTKESL